MISKIHFSNIATYRDPVSIEPKAINFIYGGNGAGKTTLSRFLSGAFSNEKSYLEWNSSDHEKVLVYNRDFIEQNFSEDKTLPGIFTLGSESIDLQHEIESLKEQQISAKKQKEEANRLLAKQTDDIKKLYETTRDKCWNIEVKYGAEFADALVGYRSSKDSFFKKCLSSYSTFEDAQESSPKYDQLKDIYLAAYTKDTEVGEEYSGFDLECVSDLDSFELLGKIITGKANTPIGTFIQFLGAGDWVKQGISYSHKAKGKCPFCQRDLPENLEQQIADFFDEEYEKDCEALREYYQSYSSFISSINNVIENVQNRQYSFLQYDEFSHLSSQLNSIATQNLTSIQSKIETPSKVITIVPIIDLLNSLNKVICHFNEKIRNNNSILADKKTARAECQSLIWHFFVEQLQSELFSYNKNYSGLIRGAKHFENEVNNNDTSIRDLETQIHDKESELTSVLPTVSAINRILDGFGFVGFSLSENPQKPGTYLIVRPDGSDASRTLSEGEHNFISFLYFYHLCFGSQTNTGITDEKILVIDDPISSLDSNVLFVIATLVKSIIQNVRNNENGINQVFVLTHNIYFHKEVTYLGSRENFSPKEASYFIIRKKNDESSIVCFSDNPIKTSYEILWDELKQPNISSAKSVFNTMRRILEHYFQVIGGIRYEECINYFEGEDKIICKSLIAYINDGSHSIFDDLVVSIDESSLDNYLRVFKLIFERLHHIDHYNMMMGIESKAN